MVKHRLTARGKVQLRTIYIARHLRAATSLPLGVLEVGPLLRELVLHIVAKETLESYSPADERLAHVLVDQLQPIAVTPLRLRIPTDSAGAEVASRLRLEPGADLNTLARDAGVSRRTLERKFHEQTDMSLGRWRQRLQLMVAIELLASGASVSEAGRTVGYSSTSAFVTAFRSQMGVTPGRYFEGSYLRSELLRK